MENSNLIAFMEKKGMSRSQLAKLSGIPQTTLNRIINGKTQKVKMQQMEAIARALNTTVYTIFDVPLNPPSASVLTPEEAGVTVEKILSPEESLLLYYFQNSFKDGQAAIMVRAKAEYHNTQTIIANRNHSLSESGTAPAGTHTNPVNNYIQMALPLEYITKSSQ